MVVKVTQPDGPARYSDIATGVMYAARNGAAVIHISFRGQLNSATLHSAIAAASETAVVVSSAGNDGDDAPVHPAAYDPVLAVTGTDRWSPAEVRAQIVDTADDIDGLNPGFEDQLGSRRINAARAVTRTTQTPPGSGREATSGPAARRIPGPDGDGRPGGIVDNG